MGARILRFSVRGEGGHIHVVRAAIGERTVTLTCSCDGDRRSHMCHHREALLDGDTSQVLSKNKADVSVLIEAAERTDFGRWFSIRRAYDGSMSAIRTRLAAASQRYAVESDLKPSDETFADEPLADGALAYGAVPVPAAPVHLSAGVPIGVAVTPVSVIQVTVSPDLAAEVADAPLAGVA